ncbi:hypothetical protein [Glaciihabitans sp. UYNi722]|uniref:hypothetical protein n=1 Tax=Glaciihabitans sp. UYNi722 TaxID=3156344 RepID=UPI00339AF67D
MDYEFNGLPLHVLLVHFVVIVVPLAALRTALVAAWPAPVADGNRHADHRARRTHFGTDHDISWKMARRAGRTH